MNSRDKILAKVKSALSNKLVNEEIIPIIKDMKHCKYSTLEGLIGKRAMILH